MNGNRPKGIAGKPLGVRLSFFDYLDYSGTLSLFEPFEDSHFFGVLGFFAFFDAFYLQDD
ncbi:hypothetical protein BTA51_20105 [Hahella sp. CCB-MM4]|uniref:hypothetical protein n=1 Tax=Hahella sp. (strain CCB-MM4) TaxID=1926491 RepID=UPI000B9B868C|nr:hypothetical protein [Hahella sp. CCB-MM4]OZG71588.1 hypothetical protein BTA51_20105 [Hahella sp. CCB-MM4]